MKKIIFFLIFSALFSVKMGYSSPIGTTLTLASKADLEQTHISQALAKINSNHRVMTDFDIFLISNSLEEITDTLNKNPEKAALVKRFTGENSGVLPFHVAVALLKSYKDIQTLNYKKNLDLGYTPNRSQYY